MIGKKLRGLIEQQGIKQTVLAKQVGISPSRLSNYLSDKREPDIQTLGKLALLLGADLNYFTEVDFSAVNKSRSFRQETGASPVPFADGHSTLLPRVVTSGEQEGSLSLWNDAGGYLVLAPFRPEKAQAGDILFDGTGCYRYSPLDTDNAILVSESDALRIRILPHAEMALFKRVVLRIECPI